MPYEINNPKLIRGFQDFLLENDIPVYNIDYEVADNAARLRGKYKSLKGLDALQIALALDHRCDLFVTNDSQLRAVQEINVVLMDELAKDYGSPPPRILQQKFHRRKVSPVS